VRYALFTSIVLIAGVASAEADPEVQKHFDLGNQYYAEGRYDDALVEYDKAYALSKNFKILYNRGQVLVMLRRDPEAIEAFEEYLSRGGTEVPEDRRKAVEADLEKLRQRLAHITLEKAPDGLEILIDGHPSGTTPLKKPLVVGAGKHTIALRRGPSIVFNRDVLIAAGDTKAVEVEIAPEPKEKVVVVAPPEPTGLPVQAIHITLGLGVAVPLANVVRGRLDVLGGVDLTGQWRPSALFSIGTFLGGATGKVELSSVSSDEYIKTSGQYGIAMGGVRGEFHLLRDKHYDGWLGIDIGVWRETWRFTSNTPGKNDFEWNSTSPAGGIVGGLDFPIAKTWALGATARFFGTAVGGGSRVGCGEGDPRCDRDNLPGGGGLGLRGIMEVMARVTWSIVYGT
jgi:hypothetical protein